MPACKDEKLFKATRQGVPTGAGGIAVQSLIWRTLPALLFALLWASQPSYAASCDEQSASINQLKTQIDELGKEMDVEVECSAKHVSLSKQRLKAFKTFIAMEDKLVKSCPQFSVIAGGRKLNEYTMGVLAKEPAKCAKITPVITPGCTRAMAIEHYKEYFRLFRESEKITPDVDGPHKEYCIQLYKQYEAEVAVFDYAKANSGCIDYNEDEREDLISLERPKAKQDFSRRELAYWARDCNPDVKLDWFVFERHW